MVRSNWVKIQAEQIAPADLLAGALLFFVNSDSFPEFELDEFLFRKSAARHASMTRRCMDL